MNMKHQLAYILASVMALNGWATDRVETDFTFGIPEDWILIDNDGNTPSNSAKSYGFEVGTAWVLTEESDGNRVVASTSWYNPKGTADDWMIIPTVEISAETVISWRAKAVDSKYRDGYTVYIAPVGAEIEDFKATEPLFQTAEEEAEWTWHEVSLADYADQEVSIAFVNDSYNMSRLFVDDISVKAPKALLVTVPANIATSPTQPVTISGTVTSDVGALGSVMITARYGETEQTLQIEVEGDEATFEFPETITLAAGEDVAVTVTAQANAAEAQAETVVRSRTRYHVSEELTGAWCGFCVKGIVAMENMHEKYSDDFIGIAVHGGDVMDVSNYSVGKYMNTDSYPSVGLNRTQQIDLMALEEAYLAVVAENAAIVGNIDVAADFDPETLGLSIDATAWLNVTDSKAGYTLGYFIVEDKVHHPDDRSYRQHNSYAGGEYGEMGGFELLDEYISQEDMWYNDVARYAAESALGVTGSLPTAVEAGKEYTHHWGIDLTGIVDDPGNCRLVVMLLNSKPYEVINAVPIELTSVGAVSSVASVSIENSQVISTQYFDLQGRSISTPKPGTVTIRVSTYANGRTDARKLIAR